MDVRFWGPSGWKLLHSISFLAPKKLNSEEQNLYHLFYESLRYVLPCKYCRDSLNKFMNKIPLHNYIHTREKLSEWVYLIHNQVNNKLRKQGFLKTENPSFIEVKKNYKNILRNECNICDISGWEFLYSKVFNYPKKKKYFI